MAAREKVEANYHRGRRLVYYSFDDVLDSRDEDHSGEDMGSI